MSQDLTASKGGIIVVGFGVEKWTTTVAAGSLFEAVSQGVGVLS